MQRRLLVAVVGVAVILGGAWLLASQEAPRDVIDRSETAGSADGLRAGRESLETTVVTPASETTVSSEERETSSISGADAPESPRPVSPTTPPVAEPVDDAPVTPPTPDDSEPSSPPGAVREIACVSANMADVITFEPPVEPVAGYVLLRAASSGGEYSQVATASADARSFVYTVAECGTSWYRVTPLGQGEAGPQSTAVTNADVNMSSDVPPSGSTLRASNGEVALVLPPGAYETTTTVRVRELSGTPTGGIISVAGVYEITPSGPLGVPATLSVAYRVNVSHFQVAETLLKAAGLMTYDEASGSWIPGAAGVAAQDGYLTGAVDHFSCWTGGTIQPHGTSGTAVDYCSGVCHDLLTYPGSSVRYSSRNPEVCYHCHGDPNPLLPPPGAPGENVQGAINGAASLSQHPVVPNGFYCTACHDPHADPHTSPGLLKAWDPITGKYVQGGGGTGPGDTFCWTCHGTVNNRRVAIQVPDYYTSANGDHKSGYPGSGHSGIITETRVTCTVCHESHGAARDSLIASRQYTTCTGNGSSCHASGANAAGGSNIAQQLTASSNNLTHHDLDPAVQAVTGARIECTNCHNVHKNSATSPVSDPDNLDLSFVPAAPALLDSNGSLYLRVGAEHDGVGPVITAIARDSYGSRWNAPRISWTTNEAATSWVDYGLTAAYELGSLGNNTLATAHAVDLAALTLGNTYHYRVRSADALGNSSSSADTTYTPVAAPAAPVPVPMADTTIYSTQPVTFSWSAVTATDGHACQYQVWIDNPANFGYQWTSGWVSATTYTEGMLKYTGDVTWMVRSRDVVHPEAISAWSTPDVFYLTDNNPDPSCPILYAFDGTTTRFISDVMGLGPIGVKKGPGAYLKPEPVEDTMIPDGALVPVDGVLRIDLADEKQEVEFVDEVKIVTVDHPVGTRVLINDLHWGSYNGGREPTEFYTIRDPRPVDVTYERIPVNGTVAVPETDVSAEAAVEGDGLLVSTGYFDDNRYVFDLGDMSAAPEIKLVISAWTDYGDRSEKMAFIQKNVQPAPIGMDVLNASGEWVEVGAAPHPPGYTKTVCYDLTDLFPADVTEYKVRIRVDQRMNLDYAAVDTTPNEAIVTTELAPASASLSYKGASEYQAAPYPHFNYDVLREIQPPVQEGAFTRYGDVLPLLLAPDDMYVVMNTGDNLAITYDEPAAPDSGMVRSYMIHTDGFHQTLTGKVDPMPFHAMSNYPYGADEHYPDDPAHLAYLATYNTRLYGYALEAQAQAGPFKYGIPSMMDLVPSETEEPVVWAERHEPTIATVGQTSMSGETEYSVDTDEAVVRVTKTDGTVLIVPATAGWQSATPSFATSPTVAAPGTAVDAATLGSSATRNGVYWQTHLTAADLGVNWQMMRFDMPVPATAIRTVTVIWYGHGEPTPGYEVKVDVWNPAGATWLNLRNQVIGSNGEVTTSSTASGTSSFCLRCHDATPPAGVVFPPGVINVGADWTLPTGDFHGARNGWGAGGTLTTGNTRSSEVACATCHQAHGSQSIYHFPASLNGVSVGTVTNGTNVEALCRSCHVGSTATLHSWYCTECHGQYTHEGPVGSLDLYLVNCLDCHKHGTSWTHPAASCFGCSDHTPPSAPRTF